MLRTRLFQSFAALLLLFGALSAWFGVRVLRARIVTEAQSRVRLDMNSARSVYQGNLAEMETVVKMAASKQLVSEVCGEARWSDPDLGSRLEGLRRQFGLDFLSLTGADGVVMLRTAAPYAQGDHRGHDPLIAAALRGEARSGTQLLSGTELEREADGLAERSFLELQSTPRARASPRTEESRGMVLVSAVPVVYRAQVVGALYGGKLVNRNEGLVDEIKDVIYGDETYQDAEMGAATVFLYDSRIATTVRKADGNRAIGTRASKEVADQVLDNGRPWIARAFVVNRWQLTAYEPIRDPDDRIIGMLYVGILEQPFLDLGRSIIWRYIGLTSGVVLLSLAVAYFIAGRLAAPIHRLVEASRLMHQGTYPEPVAVGHLSSETEDLTESFNEMVEALRERETRLQALNRSYMETLGFVTHELNTPVGSMTNYIYLLKNHLIGELNERQDKAVQVLDHNLRRVTEMVRHYLNLSRIEQGHVRPNPVSLQVSSDIVTPLVDALAPQIEAAGMTIENRIPAEMTVAADPNMLREIFENLLGNAVKYGRQDGMITLGAELAGDRVAIAVRNEGAGIPPEKLDQLFQKFSRVTGDAAQTRQRGTGLGLFIVKNLVEAHGGTIRARSEPGAWTEFTFTLPCHVQKGAEDHAEAEDHPDGG